MENDIANLKQAIAALEGQRAVLGDAIIETALAPLRAQLAALQSAPNEDALQGAHKTVTIVLADIKGSTDLAEQLPIETWVEVMNEVFKLLEAEVFRYGGEVNQFRGDGLLAFFGADTVHEDDPERAVRTALAMQAALTPFAAELHAREGVQLQLRVGVNTGEVIVTRVGNRQQHSEDTAMGQAVALAARMETAAQPGTVLVSERTYRLTHAHFYWTSLGEILVKGISQPITVYRPLAARDTPGKSRGIPGLIAALTGREHEMAQLQAALAQLQTHRGGILTLVGEAGLGKSRLLAELHADLSTEKVRWVEGYCLSYHLTSAYYLWTKVLQALLSVSTEDTPEMVQNALWERGQTLCPERFETDYPYLRALLLHPQAQHPQTALPDTEESAYQKERTFTAIRELLRGAARQQPLLIVCEDLHWADPTSLELLESVFELTTTLPLLLVCTLRPESTHASWRVRQLAALHYPTQYIAITLNPLTLDESAMLLSNLLHLEALPKAFKGRILEHAEGNPFYVEELTRSLLDSGAIRYDTTRGHWYATSEIAQLRVPETLQGVLMARIDRLAPGAKRVLQLAAVIGRSFSRRMIVQVLGQEEQLDVHLEQLQQLELIRRQERAPETHYTFKHTLTREAAYSSLLQKDRRALHRQTAEAFKKLYPDRLEEMHSLLAHHWEAAGEANRAIPHLIQAGDQATRQFANTEACTYFERALILARQTSLTLAEADIHYKLSLAHRRQGNYTDARTHLEQALSLYQQFGNRRREGIMLGDLGAVARNLGDYDIARRYFEENLNISRTVHNWRGESITHNNLGHLLLELGNPELAQAHFEQALQINRTMHDAWGEGISLGNCGYLHLLWGNYSAAETYFKQGLHLSRGVRNLRGEGKILVNVSRLRYALGAYEDALAQGQQALRIARETTHRSDQAYALVAIGQALVALGRLNEATDAYTQALELRERIGEQLRLAEPLAGLAEIALRQERHAEALAHLEPVLQQMEDHPTLCGTAAPLPILLTCYHVLRATTDPRASTLLAQAHALLHAQAETLPDATNRHTFLKTIGQEVVALVAEQNVFQLS